MLSRERATTIAFAIVGRAITLERKLSKKKQRTDTKKDGKRIKNDNFTRSNREKSNIAIEILEKLMIGRHHDYFYFGGRNNIFADCIHELFIYKNMYKRINTNLTQRNEFPFYILYHICSRDVESVNVYV